MKVAMEWFIFMAWLIPTITLVGGISILATVWMIKQIINIVKDIIKYGGV